MKMLLITIVIAAILWFIAIKIQSFQRVPIAHKIIDEKILELSHKGFDNLVQLIGKDYQQETIVRDGISYYFGYFVSRSGEISGLHTKVVEKVGEELKPGETISEVEITGYVDCVTIIPGIYFKTGPSFGVFINKSGEIKEIPS
jgi:hypothetical protein